MSNYHKLLLGATCSLALVGCIDDKYDLSNINTESEFQVKDLVLPVQLDPIQLSDIITVEEGDEIKEVTIGGKTFYAVEESGEFESEGIEVNTFKAESGELSSKTAQFKINGGASDVKKNSKRRAESTQLYYLIESVVQNIDYEAGDVDSSVRELTALTFEPLTFTIILTSPQITDELNPQLEDIEVKLPTGLSLTGVNAPGYTFSKSDYNPETGLLSLGTLKVVGGKCEIDITSNGIDLKGYDNSFTYDASTESGSFSLKSDFTIDDAKLAFTASPEALAALGTEIDFTVDYNLTELVATSIMGSIAYELTGTGLDIDPIELTDLPDFLDDPETNLILANPQIYLSLNNPVGNFGLGYQSGLEILSYRNGDAKPFPLGENNEIKVAGKEGEFTFLLAPDPAKVTAYPEGYTDPTKMTYPNLGQILSGNGLPEKLDIKLIDPMIPEQKLTEPFILGSEITGMKGTYKFVAPLALESGSKIIYTKTEDGWYGDDLEGLTITNLGITALASSDIPLDAELAIHPINKYGDMIQGLDIQSITLLANTKDQEVEFSITGNITELDGIYITATVDPDGSEEALSPTQTISLQQLRVKVSGTYKREL